jgi:hypothetical protein
MFKAGDYVRAKETFEGRIEKGKTYQIETVSENGGCSLTTKACSYNMDLFEEWVPQVGDLVKTSYCTNSVIWTLVAIGPRMFRLVCGNDYQDISNDCLCYILPADAVPPKKQATEGKFKNGDLLRCIVYLQYDKVTFNPGDLVRCSDAPLTLQRCIETGHANDNAKFFELWNPNSIAQKVHESSQAIKKILLLAPEPPVDPDAEFWARAQDYWRRQQCTTFPDGRPLTRWTPLPEEKAKIDREHCLRQMAEVENKLSNPFVPGTVKIDAMMVYRTLTQD